MNAITLEGFEARFACEPDPWGTRVRRDEAVKREAILHALGSGRRGRVLEIASGNGSNSAALARRSLRFVATDGAPSAVALTRSALGGVRHAEAVEMALPELPKGGFHTVVVAEVLYYLPARDVVEVGRAIGRRLARGGRVVLAHHHVEFSDTASAPRLCHRRVVRGIAEVAGPVVREVVARSRVWRVERVDFAARALIAPQKT